MFQSAAVHQGGGWGWSAKNHLSYCYISVELMNTSLHGQQNQANKNENATCQNLRNAPKAVFIGVKVYIQEEESS